MSASMSRRVFLAEVVFVAVPFSLAYLLFGTALFVLPAFTTALWPYQAVGVLGSGVFVAVLAAWVLILSYLRAGADGLRARGPAWWMVAGAGAVIVLAAALSTALPPSVEYSNMWVFREQLELFRFGVPLLFPLAHLLVERARRASSNGAPTPTADSSPHSSNAVARDGLARR